MNRWFTTILLTVLAAAGVLWLAFGGWTRQQLGLATAATKQSPTLDSLKDIKPGSIQRIARTLPNGDTIELKREKTDWALPGNWPVRQADANDLATTLCDLKTRFQPIALGSPPDLKQYGLDASQKPLTLRIDADAKTLTLLFGQSPTDESAFGKATWLRLDEQPEVLRLGPDAWAALTKPADSYRRRQLFPDADRLKLTGGEPAFNPMSPQPASQARALLPTDKLSAVKVEGMLGGFSLKRVAANPKLTPDPERPSAEASLNANQVAAVWELAEASEAGNAKPLRDRVDPAKLRGVLTAIPDLWAEQFVTGKSDVETGLDKPERSLHLSFANGSNAVLRIGKLSRRVVRDAAPPAPPPFGAPPPPPPQPKVEEYYFARLDNNPLVFEIRSDKLNDLFATPDDLRDANLTRFETNDVTELTVAVKGQPPIKITRKKGNKDAEKDEDKQDRWYLGDRLAEASKVTELLDGLSRLEAKGKEERIDDADAKKLADLGFAPDATKVTVISADKAGATSTTTFVIGKQDADKKKLNVQVAGWPRVNVVADDVLKLIDRPVLAYRGRRLFDTADAKLVTVTVTPASGEAFALKQDAEKKWQITQPVAAAADELKATQITGDLSRLEVTDYVDDAPKPEDLDKKYGLAKPSLTVKLGFEGNKEQTLELGKSPEFKPEVYARIAGTPGVFTLPKPTIDSLTAGAAGLMPLQIWSVASDKVNAIEIERGAEKYKLSSDGGNWKITGAFDAPVPYLVAQPLLTAATNLKAEKYETISAADLAKFGLDKPALKIGVSYKEMKGEKEESVSKTIVVGAVPADNPAMRYAMIDGTKAVFVMPDPLVKEADKSALDRLDKTLYLIDPSSIVKVAIAGPSPDKSATLVKEKVMDKDVWKVEGKPFAVDFLSAMGVANNASRPVAASLAAYGANLNFTEYGLDKPEYTVTVTMSDMKSHTIKLGKPAPGGGRYARADDGPAVAILSEPSAKALTRSPLEFVDRALFAFDPAQLAGFVRKEGDKTLELAPSATAGWDLVQPVKFKADQTLMDDLADQLSRLRVQTVAAFEPKELEQYGLAKPFAVLTLKVGLEKPEEKSLKIGKASDEKAGDRYVTVDGKTIGVLPGALVSRLLAEPLKFRDRTLAKFVDADRATLTRGDRTVTFAKVSGTWKLVKPVTADAEQGELDELINAVAKLRADELAAEKPASLAPYGLEKTEAIWTFAAGDKEVLKLNLGNKNGERVHAKVEGSDIVALLDPALTNRLFSEYRKRAVWSVDAAQAEVIAVSAGSSNFSLRKQGAIWVDGEKPGDAVNAAAVTEFLDALASLKAAQYIVDEKADFKLFGLEPPQRVIVITQRGGAAKTLHVGREEGGSGGRYYARVADKDRTEVFVIDAAEAAKLLKDRTAFAGKLPEIPMKKP